MSKELNSGRKLIAEFMGGKILTHTVKTPLGDMDVYAVTNLETPSKSGLPYGSVSPYLFISELKYHISWDWIIPVCKKIESIDIDYELKKAIRWGIFEYDIELVFNSVVNALKIWYESNNLN